MRHSFFALVVLAICSTAAAAPTIQELHPAVGFPWGRSQVNIVGSDLLGEPFVGCYTPFDPCPVTVLFGNVPGDVINASPGNVLVYAPAHAEGVTDVTIKVVGRPDAFLPNAFTFDDLASAHATGDDWASFFIPVNANEVPGANGSIWKTEFTVHNPTEFTVPLDGHVCETPFTCPPLTLAPGETKSIVILPGRGESAGLMVPGGIAGRLSMSLRVRDLSRDAQNWGTELPVLPLSVFTNHVQRLLDVPTDPRYRVLLRAFGVADTIVRVHPLSGNDVLDELHFEPSPDHSGVLAIDPITPAVRASGHERVRVVVEFLPGPIDEPPYNGGWAFISLTNNQTQHVTIISPQR